MDFDTSEICDVFMSLLQLISTARYVVLSLQVHVFAFEEHNMKFTMNMLLTCILYCDAKSGCD